MTTMQLLGFVCSLVIGLLLGLMGAGGSILTIPVLVYLLGINPLLSTIYSLFVVGITSLVGSASYIQKQQVHYRVALLFLVPSFGAIFLTRRYVVPAIPDLIFINESFRLSKDIAFMLLVAIIMLVASILMITDRQLISEGADAGLVRYNSLLLIGTGLLVGSLSSLVGIGGGFLIIPALVLLVRLPMTRAVGTSLLIIATNSLASFLASRAYGLINWPLLLFFTALAVTGILLGAYLSRFISGVRLRKVFGWFVLVLSVYIIGKEMLTPSF